MFATIFVALSAVLIGAWLGGVLSTRRWFALLWRIIHASIHKELRNIEVPLYAGHGNGSVLEIGAGLGDSIRLYAKDPAAVEHLYLLDPNEGFSKPLLQSAIDSGIEPSRVTVFPTTAEKIPLPAQSVDLVVGCLVLCSVDDPDMVMREVKRVLKPGGRFLFVEHIHAPPDQTTARFLQDLLSIGGAWGIFADGCHLKRSTGKMIEDLAGKEGWGEAKVTTGKVPSLFGDLIAWHAWGEITKAA